MCATDQSHDQHDSGMRVLRSSERLLACCSAAAHRVFPGFASSEPLNLAMSHLSQHCTTAYMHADVSVYDPNARSAVSVCPTLQLFAIYQDHSRVWTQPYRTPPAGRQLQQLPSTGLILAAAFAVIKADAP